MSTAAEALGALDEGNHDCMVVDLFLPQLEGIKLIEEVKTQPRFVDLPVVVYTNKDLTESEDLKLKKYAQSVIVKRSPLSRDKLIQDTSLFLHRVSPELPGHARETLRDRSENGGGTPTLHGRTVLVVDDDIRNIYAMTSLLEPKGIKVLFAENGRSGIEQLDANLEIALVMLDIMMPEMDG